MSAIVLESAEFAYLLAAVQAESVVGVEDAALFPSDKESRDTTYTRGLQSMKEHGWIKPASKPYQFRFNDMLFLMVAVVANPDFVVRTARHTGNSERQAIMHYMAGPDIVELVATPDRKFHLGLVPDRATLFERIEGALGLNSEVQELQISFLTEESTIDKIKDLSVKGQRENASKILGSLGLGGLSVDSLLDALGTPETGELVVMKTENGQLKAGRKARLYRGKNIMWIATRMDASSTKLRVETIHADTLAAILDSFFQFLSQ